MSTFFRLPCHCKRSEGLSCHCERSEAISRFAEGGSEERRGRDCFVAALLAMTMQPLSLRASMGTSVRLSCHCERSEAISRSKEGGSEERRAGDCFVAALLAMTMPPLSSRASMGTSVRLPCHCKRSGGLPCHCERSEAISRSKEGGSEERRGGDLFVRTEVKMRVGPRPFSRRAGSRPAPSPHTEARRRATHRIRR